MTNPITQVFNFLQGDSRILVWLYENTDMRIEGKLIGFDEYMNLVLDDAEEIYIKRKKRKNGDANSSSSGGGDEQQQQQQQQQQQKKKEEEVIVRKKIGRIMLKGDNISLIQDT